MRQSFRLVGLCLASLGLLVGRSAADTSPRLVNLSSRGVVGTGDDLLIAGFVVTGDTPKDVLIRAVGPTLAAFNVSGSLARPRLQVFDVKGAVLATNEGWDLNLKSAYVKVGASSLPDHPLLVLVRARFASLKCGQASSGNATRM